MIILNITIIYGHPNNTYGYAHFLLEYLHKKTTINLTEFFLPENLHPTCKSNFHCLLSCNCDYYNFCNINKIAKSISDSDLIIIACTSSEYHTIPASLKIILDHLSYLWMPHRNNIPMSHKIGLIISDDYIPFLPSASRKLRKYLKFWGIKNIINLNIHNSSQSSSAPSFLSKDYVNLIFTCDKILSLLFSKYDVSCMNSKKVIKFPYSRLLKTKIYHPDKKHSININNNVIPIKKVQDNI